MANSLRWTEEQLLNVQKRRKAGAAREPAQAPAPSSTGRIRGTVRVPDLEAGGMIDSKRERKHLQQLRTLFRAGEYDVLATQVWFRIEGGRYVADFLPGKVVMIDGEPHMKLEVMDAKGYKKDQVYRRKRAQMKERYGIEIKEL